MPSPISIVASTLLSEGPALAGPDEVGLSEAGPSNVGSSGINYYTLYIIKFNSFIWIILIFIYYCFR